MFMMCVGDNAGSALLLRFVLCWNGQYTSDARGSITVPLHKWTLGGRLDALQVQALTKWQQLVRLGQCFAKRGKSTYFDKALEAFFPFSPYFSRLDKMSRTWDRQLTIGLVCKEAVDVHAEHA
jgi:hypothetical protein